MEKYVVQIILSLCTMIMVMFGSFF